MPTRGATWVVMALVLALAVGMNLQARWMGGGFIFHMEPQATKFQGWPAVFDEWFGDHAIAFGKTGIITRVRFNSRALAFDVLFALVWAASAGLLFERSSGRFSLRTLLAVVTIAAL